MKNKVKLLYDTMVEENLLELEINSKEYAVSIKRKKSVENAATDTASEAQNKGAQTKAQKSASTPAPAAQSKNNAAEQTENADSIKSPISGIFYRAPSPASPPFVNEGDIVEAGKVICIIEAMKVMNEIKSPSKVKILKICLENAKSVAAGQDIFEIEKS
ncbi:MAG: acetyl-CoA carboxylase, biotin carboxyl carrier protein [Elusimicrobiota bacterium]|jgi:acetyl-CoA carboxylase biotin carboxyl carrier protein|nr:acetyl-CoA carboxylase, biotin carboxyl carrier protein [Elusimicrobiota bacterium]